MSEESMDHLFSSLATETSPDKLRIIQDAIWDEWMNHDNPVVQELMEKGMQALGEQEVNQALDCFTQVIGLVPAYPEGWNKRATAYFLRGNYKNSIEDIEEALRLEKRHFGALSGLASIYLTIGDLQRALKALQSILNLMPHDARIKEQVEAVQRKLDLDGI